MKQVKTENHLKPLTASPALNPWRWPLHFLIVTCFLLGFIIRFSWPTLTPEISPLFNFTKTQSGAYMSAFYIGYIITQIPAGILADRFGIRVILTLALFCLAIGTWLLAGLTGYYHGFILRIFTGFGGGMIYASCIRAVVSLFSPKERSIAFGILMAAPTTGVLVSNWVLPKIHLLWGWQFAFKSLAVVTAVMAILTFFTIKDQTKSQTDSKGATYKEALHFVFTNRQLMFLSLAGFCVLWCMVGYVSFANSYLTDLNFSLKDAGYVMVYYGLGGTIGAVFFGSLTAVLGGSQQTNRRVLMFLALGLAPFMILFSKTTSFALLSFYASMIGFIIGASNTFLTILVADFAGPKWAGTAGGIAGTFFQTGSIVSPLVLGLVVDYQGGSYNLIWWILAITSVIGMFLVLGTKASKTKTMQTN